MKPSRHQIAAGVTVVALGALATVALASGSTPSNDTAAAPRSAPEVRTEIVRETVHRRARSSAVRASSSPSAGRSIAAVAPDHQRRGTDDVGVHGGRHGDDGDEDHGRHGSDDVGFDDHGGHGSDDDGDDVHGGGGNSGHGGGGHDD